MVSQAQIDESNARIKDSITSRIAVFVGGTSGIGQYTIRALVATGITVKIYLVGRKSSEERTRAFIQELNAINPKAEIIWTEGDITLLAETKRICQVINSVETRIDILFMTAGYAPFGGRVETSEGLEIVQSLAYYSRILFIMKLLPLLRNSEAPRVVSVLAGGLERATSLDLEDLDLKKPGNFGAIKAQSQYATLNTVAMERLANDNPDITFIHSWPGWVSTGNVRRGYDPNSAMGWFVYLFLEPLIRTFAIRNEDSGQRHLFQSTSAAFGGRGAPWVGDKWSADEGTEAQNRVLLVNYKCDHTPNSKVIQLLRENAMEKVWEHTMTVLGRFL